MDTLLITGGDHGNGFEAARQYADDGCRAHAVCLQELSLGKLEMLGESVNVHCLGVSDQAVPVPLASAPRGEAIDLLINNAVTFAPDGPGTMMLPDLEGIYQSHADQRGGPGLRCCRV